MLGAWEAGSVCGTWEWERWAAAEVGGDAQPTTSVLRPGTLIRVLRPYSRSGWLCIPHLSSPLSPSHIVSDSKFLSGSCKVIQLLPIGSLLSPNSLRDEPVPKVQEQPSVP